MDDPYLQNEWKFLCDRLHKCAEMIAINTTEKLEFSEQADEFANRVVPTHYRELLEYTAAAANIAKQWRKQSEADVAHQEEVIDEALDESFPAGDPPTFSHAHA